MVSLGLNELKLCFAAETTAAEGSSLLATSGPPANSMPISVSGPLCTLPVYLELGRHFRSLPVRGCSRRSESRQGPQDRTLWGSWGLVVLLMITAVDGQCVVYQQGTVFVRTLLIIQLTSYSIILRDIWVLTSLKGRIRKISQSFNPVAEDLFEDIQKYIFCHFSTLRWHSLCHLIVEKWQKMCRTGGGNPSSWKCTSLSNSWQLVIRRRKEGIGQPDFDLCLPE